MNLPVRKLEIHFGMQAVHVLSQCSPSQQNAVLQVLGREANLAVKSDPLLIICSAVVEKKLKITNVIFVS